MKNQVNLKEGIVNNDGKPIVDRIHFQHASIKELIAMQDVQAAIRQHVSIPGRVLIKEVRNSYLNKETGITTQKVKAVSGTSLLDMVSSELTLVNTELDPVKSINKLYRLVDYTFALDANMDNRQFMGYAAKALRLMVTKLEEITETEEK